MKKLTKMLFLILLLSAIRYPLSATYAAVPHLLNYQGRLTDSSGNPLNGSYSLTFRIYDAESAGNLLWEETQSGVVIQKGIFSILLGSVTDLNLPFDKPYWLEIKVGTEVMSPRQRITSAGYALRAEKAEKAERLIDASAIDSGTVPTTRLGSGSASSTTFLRGDQSWQPISSISLGSWASATKGSVVRASTDGFLVVYCWFNDDREIASIKTDSSNPPTTIVQKVSGFTTGYGLFYYSMMSPVKKNDYYLIETSDIGKTNAFWIPLS